MAGGTLLNPKIHGETRIKVMTDGETPLKLMMDGVTQTLQVMTGELRTVKETGVIHRATTMAIGENPILRRSLRRIM